MNKVIAMWAFSDSNSGERKKMELELTFMDVDDDIPFHISFQKRKFLFNGKMGEKTVIEIKKGNQVLTSGEVPDALRQSLEYFLKTEEF